MLIENINLNWILFPRLLDGLICPTQIWECWEDNVAVKSTIISKIFEKFWNNMFIGQPKKLIFSSDYSFFTIMVSGHSVQLKIFWQCYLIELLGLSLGLRLCHLLHLTYPRLFAGFAMYAFFPNSKFITFQIILDLLHYFPVTDISEWLWMGCFHENSLVKQMSKTN